MAELASNYVKRVKRKTTYWGAWEPNRPFQVGDIVVYNSREGFAKKTTIGEHLAEVAERRSDLLLEIPALDARPKWDMTKSGYAFGTTFGASVKANAHTQVAPATQETFKTRVSLNKAASFVMVLGKRRVWKFATPLRVDRLVEELARTKNWGHRWGLVTEVVEAHGAKVVIAESRGGQILIESETAIRAQADLGATLGISVSGKSTSLLFYDMARCTPLMQVLEVTKTVPRRRPRAGLARPRRGVKRGVGAKRAASKATRRRSTLARRR